MTENEEDDREYTELIAKTAYEITHMISHLTENAQIASIYCALNVKLLQSPRRTELSYKIADELKENIKQ